MYFFVYFVALIATIRVYAEDSSVCNHRNGYVRVDGVCDAYIECKDFSATKKLCPDGLYFDASAVWPADPCGYPFDVPCQGRTQPAQPTKECQHQYGFFPSTVAKPFDCGQYRICIRGRAYEMFCPRSLAFNPSNSRCDYPENVPSCNLDNFLGYKMCPAGQVDSDGYPIETNHKYEGSCYEFYACLNGNARLLSCDPGYAFDAQLARCVEADRVDCNH